MFNRSYLNYLWLGGLANLEHSLHVLALGVCGQVAVDLPPAGRVGTKLENDRLACGSPFRNAIRAVDGEAVCDVVRLEGDLHHVALVHRQRGWAVGVVI